MSAPLSEFPEWPLSPEQVGALSLRFEQLALGNDGALWWSESRLSDGTMTAVCRTRDGTLREMVPADFRLGSRVHEYGGGDLFVEGECLFVVSRDDQQIHCFAGDGSSRAITRNPTARYADMSYWAVTRQLIAVRELHPEGGGAPSNALVAISIDTGCEQVIDGNHDFVSSPCVRADGRELAWIGWDHPHMPWDETQLWRAWLNPDGTVGTPQRVAGCGNESIVQPAWSPDGRLYFISDRSGWWNIYTVTEGQVCALWPKNADFAGAQWTLKPSTYSFDAEGRLVCTWCEQGEWKLGVFDPELGKLVHEERSLSECRQLRVQGEIVAFIGGSPERGPAIMTWNLRSGALEEVRRSMRADLRRELLSKAQALSFPTDGDAVAYAFYYPPEVSTTAGSGGRLPPAIINVHGGPIAAAVSTLRPAVQFWTSRGFAYVDLNHRGSTGFGRDYRRQLCGQWGVADVEDAVQVVKHLAEQGRLDAGRCVVRGASAGGYTVLRALTTTSGIFAAGISHYGIADLVHLVCQMHKFEKHDTVSLIAPYPERVDVYRQRSPLNAAHRLSSPLLLVQGLEDTVVPPDQAESMYSAARDAGASVSCLLIEGEGHGFRRPETISRVLDAELRFLAQVLQQRTDPPVTSDKHGERSA